MNKTQLYNPKILNIYKNLQYFKKDLNQDKIIKCNEIRMCGLKICLEVEIINGVINSIYYNGTGDCICIASTEILCKVCRNKHIDEVKQIINQFFETVEKKEIHNFSEDFIEIQYLIDISIYPLKIKNIIMSWSILKSIIHSI